METSTKNDAVNVPLNNTIHNRELMKKARESLKGKWGKAIGATLMSLILIIPIGLSFAISTPIVSPGIRLITNLFLNPVFNVGFALFWLVIARQKNSKISQVFSGFKIFWKCFAANFMMIVFILLWTLLLIVPGIMAIFSYSMTFFVIADNHKIGPIDAISQSKKIMYGHRWKLFCLGWRFFWWNLLCLLSLGVGYLWLIPYIGTSFACFYDDIKQ